MSEGTLLTAVRHNTWANLELLGFCGRLPAERLAWTAPGTYGTIHATLHHIVGAEHGYLLALTGSMPPIETERGGRAMTPEWLAPIDELIERERSNGERMERAVVSDLDPARVIARRRGGTATARVIASQYIHHGSDHRAHIGTILGGRGVEPPDLDVWAYGKSIGEVS